MPELFDLAEQLNITESKKLEKQDLIYKILDKQAINSSEVKDAAIKKPRTKKVVTVKTSTANITEEAEVMSEEKVDEKMKLLTHVLAEQMKQGLELDEKIKENLRGIGYENNF